MHRWNRDNPPVLYFFSISPPFFFCCSAWYGNWRSLHQGKENRFPFLFFVQLHFRTLQRHSPCHCGYAYPFLATQDDRWDPRACRVLFLYSQHERLLLHEEGERYRERATLPVSEGGS